MKNKRYETNELFRIDIFSGINVKSLRDIEEVEDFELLIRIPHRRKITSGSTCNFYSKEKGFTISFPLWHYPEKDIITKGSEVISIGTISKPYWDADQGYQIVIFEHRNYIYALQGNSPGCEEYHSVFKVNKDYYLNEWDKLIQYVKDKEGIL